MTSQNEDHRSSSNEHNMGWSTPGEAWSIVRKGRNLKNTVGTALIVGTILFMINQLDVVISREATWLVWFKVGLTYAVPFIVSNIGILSVTKRARVNG